VIHQHKDYEAQIVAFNNQKQLGFAANNATKNLYYWLRLVIMSNFPFSVVENQYIREGSKFEPISVDTFMKYFKLLDDAVMMKIKEVLPNKFGLIFDGWSSGTTHFVAIYAVFPSSEGKREQVMLAMQPLPDETNQTANNHIDFMISVLGCYGKSRSNVVFICGDNCNTNRRIATDMHLPLIGCRSHLFNLAVENYVHTNFNEEVNTIEKLSGKLRNKKAAGKLRQLGCKLEAVSRNATRWSSAFEMIKRYREIKSYVTVTNFPELVDYIPTPSAEATIEGMFQTFEKLQSITVALQIEDLRLCDARALLDAAISLMPNELEYLAADATILHTPKFQSAVVKIQNEDNASLTQEEENLVLDFKIHHVDLTEEAAVTTSVDFATELLQARKKPKVISNYTNLDWIPPTSNVVERLFSLARLTFTDYRQATLPENLETTLFLKINVKFWNIETVAQIMASD
jgi:hypothetical protein